MCLTVDRDVDRLAFVFFAVQLPRRSSWRSTETVGGRGESPRLPDSPMVGATLAVIGDRLDHEPGIDETPAPVSRFSASPAGSH